MKIKKAAFCLGFAAFTISASYNQKMCFIEDASSWQNLNDLANFSVSSYSYTDINISENWFATSVVCGWLKNGSKRYITYADALVAQSKNILVRFTIKNN